MFYDKLFTKLKKISTKKEKEIILDEWEYIDSYTTKEVDSCLCGHKIKRINIVENKLTHKRIKIGCECIKHFKNIPSYILNYDYDTQEKFSCFVPSKELDISFRPR